eukprot:scaffold230487_cov31-Tisochrysis_lutea.AAC.1
MLLRRVTPPCTSASAWSRQRCSLVPVHCHVDVSVVAKERLSSCLRHLIKRGAPIPGLTTIFAKVIRDEAGLRQANEPGTGAVCVSVESIESGVAVVKAAHDLSLRPVALLGGPLSGDGDAIAEAVRMLQQAGAESVIVPLEMDADAAHMRDILSAVCDREEHKSALGLRLASSPGGLALARMAREELGVRHFLSCIAGKSAPRPSDLFKSLGMGPPSVNTGALFLAEHVPDAG